MANASPRLAAGTARVRVRRTGSGSRRGTARRVDTRWRHRPARRHRTSTPTVRTRSCAGRRLNTRDTCAVVGPAFTSRAGSSTSANGTHRARHPTGVEQCPGDRLGNAALATCRAAVVSWYVPCRSVASELSRTAMTPCASAVPAVACGSLQLDRMATIIAAGGTVLRGATRSVERNDAATMVLRNARCLRSGGHARSGVRARASASNVGGNQTG